MLLVGTSHNRRGDPLLLLRLLKLQVRDRGIERLGVVWSVPSGNLTPDHDELAEEELRIQETLRRCVRLVHNSNLSWDAKSFLGRCFRSFQYEFMVALNLMRNNERLKIVLVDDPQARDARYKEIGNPETFLETIGKLPNSEQSEVLRTKYEAYRTAYDDSNVYERMILHPDSALLEISPDMSRHTDQREEYMALAVQNSRPDVVIGRLIHGLHEYPPELRASGLVPEVSLGRRIGLSGNNILKLSDAVSLVGPLPARD
ncbi:hypothetical protein E6H23_07115 [Candidatus Bathyarchaeota archaeon]|nr:MAG: hypothetical protein E6H23_07115 [Candidatus Bathyarchaeota archaeon]